MPLNIRFFVGRREIIRSLGTHDLKVARKAVIEMADKLDKLFSKIQMGAELLSSSDPVHFYHAFCVSKTKTFIRPTIHKRRIFHQERGPRRSVSYRPHVPLFLQMATLFLIII